MSVDRPIIKKDAFMYLLGFHCAGAMLSEDKGISVGFNTTVEASSDPESSGTATPESSFSTGGTVTTTGNNYAIPLVIEDSDYFTVPEKTHETTDPVTGEPVPVDITDSYTDQTIGNAAVSYGADCYSHDSYYSQDNRSDKNNPPGTYGYYYDCSSLVSRIYNKVLTAAGYTDYGNSFANYHYTKQTTDDYIGWHCCNTESLATLADKRSLFICINCYDESLLLPGDIILWKRDHTDGGSVSSKKYYLNHAALYIGNGRILHITTHGDPMYYQNVYSPERIRFVLRPSLYVLGCKGLSIDHTKEFKDSHGILTFPNDYKQSVYIPQGSDAENE